MKWFFLSLGAFLSFPCMAADNQANSSALTPLKVAPPAPKIVIVDGKKFYSLQNARRFTGSTNSPSALMVIHHPRSPETIISHRATLGPASASGGGSANSTGAPSTAQPSDVLSVFAPDDKSAPLLPPTTAPTK